jgi:hypothetical protein
MAGAKTSTKIVNDVVESPHPYRNSAKETQWVRIPGARKFKLTFDPQFKTESSYDYLELWLDENKENRYARWEGTEYPTEPLEIETENFLHFTFTSDDSTNYWGYKIDVEAEVVVVESNWLVNLRDTCNYLIVFMTKTLIDGSFADDTAEDGGKAEILSNLLVKYGIDDSCLWMLDPEAKRELDHGLLQLSLTQDVTSLAPLKEVLPMPTLGKAVSSFEGMNTKFSKRMTQKTLLDMSNVSLNGYIKNFDSGT